MRRRELRASLPGQAASAAEARRLVRQALEAWGRPEASGWASLVATELVTNAVVHARTALLLVMRLDSALRIEVHDGDRRPAVPRDHRPLSARGRGLELVAEASDRWGSDATPAGKVVWAELDRPASRRPAGRGATRGG
ncbi:MAG TPA: ATP-binding protein [Acidimicrobiales bacterium]|nr:ATP-binding protein [Acidimicrobiales bacterium]